MRIGFTTGSCAAAASKAAAYMLMSGMKKEKISIMTPKGIEFNADITDISIGENEVSCAVKKDGGDDPDVTSGALIYAKVSFCDESRDSGSSDESNGPENIHILIDGGTGVGRVTKPGLDQPVGNAAINSVPRQMITDEVIKVAKLFDYSGLIKVIISVPEGESISEKTFNPRLGIVGGISILGTSGIVEPMSVKALLDTIRVELNQKKVLGYEKIVIAPGNYGLDFMKNTFDYDLDGAVKCSNYIGETLDMIGELGFKKVLLCGHIGKLIKVSGGIMNTHSREADCRMELMASAALSVGMSGEDSKKILDCVSTEAGFKVVRDAGFEKPFMNEVMKKIMFYLKKRVNDKFLIECIVFSNEFGLMGESAFARTLLTEIMEETENDK
ncbi:MAG: cobalt-precorrin-5B (C(1))-methyltransferase CbiD [Acetatifactor sp.]|nr:cobalt-precorrin-5B (C(1))-methyltransferase CbiD [Acetatifactor sp.]